MEVTPLESHPHPPKTGDKLPTIKIVLPGKDPKPYDTLLDDLEEVSFTALAKIKAVIEAKSTEYLGNVYTTAYSWYFNEDPAMLSVLKSEMGKYIANEEILSIVDSTIAAKESKKE